MRKIPSVISLSISAIIVIASTSPALAAPTARSGASCQKKNSTQIIGSKKLTCVLIGKKLLWDKGVSVNKNSSGPTQSTSSSPIAGPSTSENANGAAQIDTKSYAWSFRINPFGTLERKGGPLTSWTIDPNRVGQVIDPIRKKAFEAIQNYSNSAPSKSVKVNFAFGPNIDKSAEIAYRNYFESSIRFFESRIPQDVVLNVLVVTEKDDDFTQATLLKFLGDPNESAEVFARNKTLIHQFDSLGKQASGGGSVGSFGPGKPLLYFGYICSCFNSEDLLMYNVGHEMTHYFQFATTPSVKKQNFVGNYPNWVEGEVFIPNSLIEGSANTFGSAILVKHLGWYSDMMDWHLGRYKKNGAIKRISSQDEAVKLMMATKSWNLEAVGLSELNYALGELIWEYYVAQFGVKSYLDLFDNIEKYGEFNRALQATENISELDFYRNAASYVMQAFNVVDS